MAASQLRLLLWKDYLIRKRKLVTLAGVLWATTVMLCLYAVRINVDNQDFQSCQFPARALPSGGMLTFVQSFICSVDNECSPLDQYQEIPTYENSKLTQLQRRFSPLLHNETVLEAAGTVPGALKLLATFADVLDDPDMVEISKNGLRVRDLFARPGRARRYLAVELNMTDAAAGSMIDAKLSLAAIFNGDFDRCNPVSMANLLQMENQEHLVQLVQRLCDLPDEELQKIAGGLIVEINFSKYITMISKMYFKISGDVRIPALADMVTAVLRLTKLESFLPRVVASLLGREPEFSYFDVSWITQLMDQFEPAFGGTQAYKTIRDFSDTVTIALQYIDKLFAGQSGDPVKQAVGLALTQVGNADEGVKRINDVFSNAVGLFEEAAAKYSVDIFKILAQITITINKFLPEQTQHEVLLFSTLLAKLIEGATRVVAINLNIKDVAYDVSLRNPEGVKVLMSLPVSVVRKGFEGLADAERVQIVSSKMNNNGQMFCDSNKLASFFKVSKSEADAIKGQLCTDAWKNYVGDLLKSFGIYEVRDIINNMASIVVQETFGKDITNQLYTIEQDFEILKNFTETLVRIRTKEMVTVDWNSLLNVSDDSEFMRIFAEEKRLGKQVLITVHGALAKEVVKQNAILDYKISPILVDMTTIVTAIKEQLEATPKEATDGVKALYSTVLITILKTLLDEEKTYKALSTPSEEVFCNGTEVASSYLTLPSDSDDLVRTLCSASQAIENGLKGDSKIAKAIARVKSSRNPLSEVAWTSLIDGLKRVYMKLDADYPYLFEVTSYGMDEEMQAKVDKLMEEAKQFWFSAKRIDRTLHLSIKAVFRLLDIVDRDAFALRSEGWRRLQHAFHAASGPLELVDDFVKLIAALSRNMSYPSQLPSRTAQALTAIVPGVPSLIVDTLNIIVNQDVDLEPIVTLMNASPGWPCAKDSLSDLLPLSETSGSAVRAIEDLMCLDSGFKDEWVKFVKERNISLYNSSQWNTAIITPNVFLRFSGIFDALVEDTVLIRDMVERLVNGSEEEEGTVVAAWNYAAKAFEGDEKDGSLRKLFSNIDTVLNSITTPSNTKSVSSLWEEFSQCKEACAGTWRAVGITSLQALSVVLKDAASDLYTYFTEIKAPEANMLQMLGFTKKTGLYILFDKFPEFVAALLNSYWDYGFMSQVRRAALFDFWDCEAVLSSISPAPDSGVDVDTLRKVKPFVCPSLLYWISLPRGDNTFLDIVAKPQHTFFTLPSQDLTSSFADAFNKTTELANLLGTVSNKTLPPLTEDDTKLSTLQIKLKETVDHLLNYKIDQNNPTYRLFNEINKKQFISATYLTRITAIVNKIAMAIENLKPSDINEEFTEEEANNLEADISVVSKIFKRRPNDAIALFFDVITNGLANNDDMDLVKAFDDVCEDLKNNDSSKDILNEGTRTKGQICSKQYKVMFGAVQSAVVDDYEAAKKSLFSFVNALQDGEGNVTDVAEFFKDRKKLINSLKSSIKYAYDLGLPIYLKYLQSNLQNYNIVLSFLSGEDWWAELRKLYDGPYVASFFDAVEQSFEVAEDVLTRLDDIHLVRLLRDVNLNDSASFCQPNVSLADYIPDSTGALSRLKLQACSTEKEQVFRDIPPLLFASQGYDEELRLSKDINYTALYKDISAIETRVEAIKDGPKTPERPTWIDDEKLDRLRNTAINVLSKETLTKITFGVLGNLVDASTLFLNNTQCTLCSHVTAFVKQLNLQLYKKQEYDSLLCRLNSLPVEAVHRALRNDFHWDMALRELVSFRNYTKYELNKSLNELLGQIKLHLLEDVSSRSRLSECLTPDARDNRLGHAALLLEISAATLTLVRAELPHLHEVDGMSSVPFLQVYQQQQAPVLDAYVQLKTLADEGALKEELRGMVSDDVLERVVAADINLRLVSKTNDAKSYYKYLRMASDSIKWLDVCEQNDCKQIVDTIEKLINKTLVAKLLPKQQEAEFWKFFQVTRILEHVERVIQWAAKMAALGSRLGAGVIRGELAPTLDAVLEVTTEDARAVIHDSIHGILEELEPLLVDSSLRRDLSALTTGLSHLRQIGDELANADLRVPVGTVFASPERLEAALSALGINNTNFWSLAAPRLRAGEIQLKPIFSWKSGDHIADYVCQVDTACTVLRPGDLGALSQEDVCGAVAEQFCGLSDAQAKRLLPALLGHVNYSYVIDQVVDYVLPQLYTAADLTLDEGTAVIKGLPLMASVLPDAQAQIGAVADSFTEEPLFKSLVNFSSVGDLLGSSEFLSSAGNMLCGKPFTPAIPRLYSKVVGGEDRADQPDQKQLDALPSDFCRSMYTDIIKVPGGKIVWSFVKPLVMGRVLYTPAGPIVDEIIHRANSSFAHMARLTSLVHSFSASFPALDKLSAHRAGAGALGRLLSAPAFRGLREMLMPGGEAPNVDLEGMLDEFGEFNGIGGMLSKVSALLRCVTLDRFRASANEDDLAREAARLTMINEFSAGLVFLNTDQPNSSFTNISYKIRMDIENTPTTSRMMNYLWIPGPEANFLENMRYFRGFVQVQDLVGRAVIEAAAARARPKREVSMYDDNWAVYTQQMPYPCYRKDFFQTSLYESQALIVAFFFSLLFTVAAAVRFLLADQESGNNMLMHVMGVRSWVGSVSWFVWSGAETAATCACCALVLCAGRVLPASAPALVLALLLLFGCSVLCFCYMISKVFSKASFGAVCAAIAYLITFMPFVLILSLEAVISRAAKFVICLSMSSSLCYAFLHVTRLEARGVGAQWSTLWDVTDPTDLSIGAAAAMMVVDALIYLAIGWIADRFFGLKTLQSNITHCTTTDEKAGVSIVNISKVYGAGSRRPKLALDNVSLELRAGQVTTLLGHNGAGKTTLINILTGMLKPSKGHIVIRSDKHSGTTLGACPQRDVLFESLTAREHVALYAQLKSGKSCEEVTEEVESLLRVMSLGAAADTQVCRLSGGTRRRVCVALAFVAAPRLVTLDEPTAGVDPRARREIWSMIERLKEERTILLTTHHMDEADLLSDQIVILHKGQVHTSGSPIEIKRALGSGYRASIVCAPDSWGTDSAEERAKALLHLVRGAVPNASLADVSPLNVDITLPFFDENGLNNDFLKVCTLLESQQEALGFHSYSMECSSLEQVFHAVCQQADGTTPPMVYDPSEDPPSKSSSAGSVRTERGALVAARGARAGSPMRQLMALLMARYLHYSRNRWLLFVLLVLPSLFVGIAMGFSTIRPPADNEVALPLHPDLYPNTAEFIIPEPSLYSDIVEPTLARRVMSYLMLDKPYKTWSEDDTPDCKCTETTQVCNVTSTVTPQLMLLPDASVTNRWIVNTHDQYIQNRYGGYSSSLANNATALVAWYNNKGHHALPARLAALHQALLQAVTEDPRAGLSVASHPLKISREQISKDTVYQHVADAGISALVVLSFSLASACACVYPVGARARREQRLQLLSGVRPELYWAAALVADMMVIVINMAITAGLMEAFHFPVFVMRNNLSAICVLILLYGFSCASAMHVAQQAFSESSVATTLLFCGNALFGLGGLTVLLVLDVISETETTDNARWLLHKIFLVAPQFALGDGLLEIAKNTIQAQVLSRFGMDTYQDPLHSDLILLHCTYMAVVGAALFALNIALEYRAFDALAARFWSYTPPARAPEEADVREERARVHAALRAEPPLRLHTIGNINAGFVDTEGMKPPIASTNGGDVAACLGLSKAYGTKVALDDLTLGIPPGQCTVLLGENGAGKSTTFSLLTGQARPSAGAVYLGGQRLSGHQLCRGLISYCPQTDAIDPLLTPRETLALYCRLRGIDDEEEVITRTLAAFELSRYAQAPAAALSGGTRRKLCAAIAFMSRAPLVLLDEPTSGMDPAARGCVWAGARAAGGAGRAVVVSTHAAGEARALAARAALLQAARLRALAPLHECLARFGGGYVVECRVAGGRGAGAWRAVTSRAPHARRRLLHHAALHFLLPTTYTVNQKEVTTRPSDVFRLMAELQGVCDIEDYAVTQTSLEEMFLSFTEPSAPVNLTDIPDAADSSDTAEAQLTSVTSL